MTPDPIDPALRGRRDQQMTSRPKMLTRRMTGLPPENSLVPTIGISQWLILKPHLPLAAWWAPATTAGILPGAYVGFMAGGILIANLIANLIGKDQ